MTETTGANTAPAANAAGHDRHFDPRAHAALGRCVRLFFRHASPILLAGFVATALAVRIVVGGWTWWDLVVAGAILAAEPFTEWLIHTYILHFRPFSIRDRRVDLHLAKEHRRHHADPKDIGLVFIPIRALAVGIPVGVAAALLLSGFSPLAFTGALTAAAMLFVYEWTHFIIHAPYRARSRYGRYVERAHRLHHFRNEKYWMGVTVHLADHVLGTFPDRSAVPASDTARTLGIG